MSDEIDFESAKPVKLVAEVSPEKTLAFFKGEEKNPLQPKEITEEMLKRLYENVEEHNQLGKLIAMDKKDAKELAAGLESVQKGGYVAFFKTRKGQRKIDWEKLSKDMIGKLSDADLAKYSTEGDPSVAIEIRKVN